jgi:hypothetical protein
MALSAWMNESRSLTGFRVAFASVAVHISREEAVRRDERGRMM